MTVISFTLHYYLGMHFSQAVAIIQSQVGVIKGVQVLYSETVSFNSTKPNNNMIEKYIFKHLFE